jgi:hypothetical protein
MPGVQQRSKVGLWSDLGDRSGHGGPVRVAADQATPKWDPGARP